MSNHQLNNKRNILIDSIRGIATISVVLFHLELDFALNGFVGVDIFFVISGYLVFNSLRDNYDSSFKSIIKFWDKRIKRIYPLLIVVCLATTFLSYFSHLPSQFVVNTKAVNSILLFSSNLFWKYFNPDYWDHSNINQYFTHSWSLSIEEQFYFILPFIFYITIKSRNLAFLSFILLFIESFYAANNNDHYATFARAWQFLLGISVIFIKSKIVISPRWKMILSILSCIFISIALMPFLYNRNIIPMTISSFGTFIFLLASVDYKNFRKNIILKFLSHIGKMSYSYYLWHLIITTQLKLQNLFLGKFEKIFFFVVLYSISNLSYYFVEKNKFILYSKNFYKITLTLVISIIVLNFAIIENRGFPERFNNNQLVNDSTFSILEFGKKNYGRIPVFNNHEIKSDIVFLGDSTSLDIALGMQSVSDYKVSRPGKTLPFWCSNVIDVKPTFRNLIEYYNVNISADQAIKECEEYENIFKSNFTKVKYLIISDLDSMGNVDSKGFVTNLQKLLNISKENGFRGEVIVLSNRPTWSLTPLGVLSRVPSFQLLTQYKDINLYAQKFLNNNVKNMIAQDAKLKGIYGEIGITYVSQTEILCPDNICSLVNKGGVTYIDNVHYTIFGAKLIAKKLKNLINK